jgi:hypothetical protein
MPLKSGSPKTLCLSHRELISSTFVKISLFDFLTHITMCVRERIITPSISACPPKASDCSSLFLANVFPTLQLSATVAFQRSPYKEDFNHICLFRQKRAGAYGFKFHCPCALKIKARSMIMKLRASRNCGLK